MMTSPIVSAEWLKKELDAGNANIRVLDVTWYSDKDAKEEYLKAHIPGAVHFNIFEGVQQTEIFPRNVASPEVFQANARAAGVNDGSHVIVYDNTGQGGYFLGSRAWWLFTLFGYDNVSVLDGGMAQWTAKGFPTSTEIPQIKPGNFTAKYRDDIKISVDQMDANMKSKHFQVVDTRPPSAYQGKKEEPATGHYPGAVNMHMAATFLDQDKKQLKSPEELRAAFSAAGVDLGKPVTAMCNSGMSSCTAVLAATMLGNKSAAVYHGGFTEWKHTHPDNIEQS